MNILTKVVIAFTIFHIVLFVIAVIEEYKENKKFLNLLEYIKNGFNGNALMYKSWAGVTIPRDHDVFVDAVLFRPAMDLVLSKLPAVHAKMTADGYVWDGLTSVGSKSTYIRRRRDCDKFVKKLLVELDDAIYLELKSQGNMEESGIAIGRCDYTKDKGGGHERWFFDCADGKRYYFEGYPHPKYLLPSDMSKHELSTASYLY